MREFETAALGPELWRDFISWTGPPPPATTAGHDYRIPPLVALLHAAAHVVDDSILVRIPIIDQDNGTAAHATIETHAHRIGLQGRQRFDLHPDNGEPWNGAFYKAPHSTPVSVTCAHDEGCAVCPGLARLLTCYARDNAIMYLLTEPSHTHQIRWDHALAYAAARPRERIRLLATQTNSWARDTAARRVRPADRAATLFLFSDPDKAVRGNLRPGNSQGLTADQIRVGQLLRASVDTWVGTVDEFAATVNAIVGLPVPQPEARTPAAR